MALEHNENCNQLQNCVLCLFSSRKRLLIETKILMMMDWKKVDLRFGISLN